MPVSVKELVSKTSAGLTGDGHEIEV